MHTSSTQPDTIIQPPYIPDCKKDTGRSLSHTVSDTGCILYHAGKTALKSSRRTASLMKLVQCSVAS